MHFFIKTNNFNLRLRDGYYYFKTTTTTNCFLPCKFTVSVYTFFFSFHLSRKYKQQQNMEPAKILYKKETLSPQIPVLSSLPLKRSYII